MKKCFTYICNCLIKFNYFINFKIIISNEEKDIVYH